MYNRTERLEIRIEEDLKDKLFDLALEQKISQSQYVRNLIIKDVRRNWPKFCKRKGV
jgi:predicted HicB family RNase H-like nuclease